jgi:hypothetical protein
MGAGGNWIKTGSIPPALVVAELVQDADKGRRYIRLASVATAFVSEARWAIRIQSEHERREHRG